MDMFLNILKVVAGFVLLIKGADFFVDGASSLAKKMKIPTLIIGLTIVAMGTSAPEAAVSISAAFKGNTGIAIGNILGSNILNVLIILGITAIIIPIRVGSTTVKYEIPFMIAITVILGALGLTTGVLGKVAGALLWVLFIAYMAYLLYQAKHMDNADEEEIKDRPIWMIILFIIGGMAAIIFGSNITVDGATYVASAFGVSDRIIGLTIVAFGTSLPELITSITAAKKGQADIAIGNIVGSNVFNILFVLGTTCLIHDVAYPKTFLLDTIVALVSVVLLFVFVIRKKQLTRPAGIIMVVGYAGYLTYMLMA